MSSLTATSATVSWTQPTLSLPVVQYLVTLSRVLGGQVLCPSVEDSILAVTTNDAAMVFTDLEEFSNYSVTVTAMFVVSGVPTNRSAEVAFITLSAGRPFCKLSKTVHA